jgi:hypothetical protein
VAFDYGQGCRPASENIDREAKVIRCYRHALASALTSVPLSRGFEVSTMSVSSGATMRERTCNLKGEVFLIARQTHIVGRR